MQLTDEWGASQKTLLEPDEVGELTLTYHRDGKKYTLRGQVREPTITAIQNYRNVHTSRRIDSVKLFADESYYFLEFRQDAEGKFANVKVEDEDPPKGKVTHSAIVDVDELTVENINNARAEANAPKNARVTLHPHTAQVAFGWEG